MTHLADPSSSDLRSPQICSTFENRDGRGLSTALPFTSLQLRNYLTLRKANTADLLAARNGIMLFRPVIHRNLLSSCYLRPDPQPSQDLVTLFHTMSSRLTQQRILMSKSKVSAELHDVAKDKRLVWVDLEMSGLEVETHKIVEMACIVTDEELNIVAESLNIVINYPQLQFSDWCQTNFAKSGLLREIADSKVSLPEAENIMLNFLKLHVNPKMSPLAGNSVHMDRIFLRKYMPKFDEYLHYRIVDVSTVKELTRRWYPDIFQQQPAKAFTHRALQDIRESIAELLFYRKNVFLPGASTK